MLHAIFQIQHKLTKLTCKAEGLNNVSMSLSAGSPDSHNSSSTIGKIAPCQKE